MTAEVSKIELPELNEKSSSGSSLIEKDFSLIKDVEVVLTALIGNSKISVDELFSLKKGAVVSLDTRLDESVSLFIKDKLIAKGTIVAVKDSYGIEITEVI